MTGYGNTDWIDELDAFEKKAKEMLESHEVEPPSYQNTFEVWEDETNEDGNANP